MAANGKHLDLVERQPPFDNDAEQGLLGSILLLPSVLGDVEPLLSAEDFYDPAHGAVYRQMLDLKRSDRPVDYTLLADRLKAHGDWERVGGGAGLARIADSVVNAAHAVYYAEIVADKATARRLIAACTKLLKEAYDGTDTAELVRLAGDALAGVSRSTDSRTRIVTLAEAADEVIAALEAPETNSTNRAMWGIPGVDEMLGPIMGGEVAILAARPKVGKTAFAMQTLMHSALQQRPCLMVSLEMQHRELASRDLCRVSGVDSRAVRDGRVQPAELARMRTVRADFGELPYYLWAPPSASLSEIRGVVSTAVNKYGVRVAAVDYLTLVDGERGSREDRREQLVKISRGLKALAKEYNIPLLVLAQLNRDAEQQDKRGGSVKPTMKTLAECGAIERDADLILFLHRDPGGPKNQTLLIAAGARHFGDGEMTLKWDRNTTTFSDLDVREHKNYDGRLAAYGDS